MEKLKIKLEDFILKIDGKKIYPTFTFDRCEFDEDLGVNLYTGLVIIKTAQEFYDEWLYNKENPQPSEPTAEEQIQKLEKENKLLKAQVEVLSQTTDFHEELITEMAMKVYA